MSFPYTTLTYNGITKIVSNELIESLADSIKVYTFQWFRYQILQMCKNMKILEKDERGGVYNNITLANKIKEHKLYGNLISSGDSDVTFGLNPCLKHKSIAPIPANKSQLKKSKNKITLEEPEYIIWKCGVLSKPLVDL